MTNKEKLLKANNLAGLEINNKITEAHPYNDELAILRKTVHALIHGEPIPEEFEAYYTEAERVKAEVKERLYDNP